MNLTLLGTLATAGLLATGFVNPPAPGVPGKPAAAKASRPAAQPWRLHLAPGASVSEAQFRQFVARVPMGELWKLGPRATADDVFNGFLGPTFQRLELVFTSVQPGTGELGQFVVSGKLRCYGVVTPFRGTITLDDVHRLHATELWPDDDPATKDQPVYCAQGRFSLQNTGSDGIVGKMSGLLAIDFRLKSNNHPELLYSTRDEATRAGGMLFEGQWTGGEPRTTQEVLWKNDLAVTSQVFSRFDVGSRMPMVNPVYARVGWNKLWSNDEWWAGRATARR